MKTPTTLLAIVAAAALLGVVGWLLIGQEPAPVPVPVPAPETKAPPPKGEAAFFVPKGGAPLEVPHPAPPDPSGEPPLPPDAYPWEVPGWWTEIDRKFRGKEIVIDDETLGVGELLDRVAKEVGFPVRVGPELKEWSADSRIAFPAVHAPARAVLENLASRTNVELVLTADALELRQRGKAPEDRVTRAGRVQWAILEGRERREGKRPPESSAAELVASPVTLVLDAVPLREAARRLGESLAIPVYMDAPLWNVNPAVSVPEGERSLAKVLDAMTAPWGAAWDVTPRRIVLFKP